MNASDAAQVLTLAAVYDNRTFDEMTARAWADALQGLELSDCLDAVKAHFRVSRQWLLPADVRERARSLIVERKRLAIEQGDRLAIEQANNDPAVVAERAALVRQVAAEAGKLPPIESPHPKQDREWDRAARKVACPWCKQPVKAGCVNTTTGRPAGTTHEARLIAAGLVSVAS